MKTSRYLVIPILALVFLNYTVTSISNDIGIVLSGFSIFGISFIVTILLLTIIQILIEVMSINYKLTNSDDNPILNKLQKFILTSMSISKK